jgi:hypothetical protein
MIFNSFGNGIGILDNKTGFYHRIPLTTKVNLKKTLEKNDKVSLLRANVLNDGPVYISNERHDISIEMDMGLYITDQNNLYMGTNVLDVLLPFFPNTSLTTSFEFILDATARSVKLTNLKGLAYFNNHQDSKESFVYEEAVPKKVVFKQKPGEPLSLTADYACNLGIKQSYPQEVVGNQLEAPLVPTQHFNIPMFASGIIAERDRLDAEGLYTTVDNLTEWSLEISNKVVKANLLSTTGNYHNLRGGTEVSLTMTCVVDTYMYEELVTPYTRNSKVTEKLFNVVIEAGNIQQAQNFMESHFYFELYNAKVSSISATPTSDGGFYMLDITFKNPDLVKVYSVAGQNIVTYNGAAVKHNGQFVTNSN